MLIGPRCSAAINGMAHTADVGWIGYVALKTVALFETMTLSAQLIAFAVIGTLSMYVPVAGTALILGGHRLLVPAFVPTFVFATAIAAVGVAKSEGELDVVQMRRELDLRQTA